MTGSAVQAKKRQHAARGVMGTNLNTPTCVRSASKRAFTASYVAPHGVLLALAGQVRPVPVAAAGGVRRHIYPIAIAPARYCGA
jgi:hypothetical protein